MKSEIKASVLTLRITERMRQELQDAAAANGRSVSQEVEQRISNSFLSEPNLGGAKQAALLSDLALLMDATSMVLGRPWYDAHSGWGLVRNGWKYLLSLVEPARDPDLKAQMSAAGQEETTRWEAETEPKLQEHWRRNRELEQLRLKEATFVLEPREQNWKELLEVLPPLPDQIELPNLDSRDLQFWHGSEESKVLRRRLWMRAKPILEQARRRWLTDSSW